VDVLGEEFHAIHIVVLINSETVVDLWAGKSGVLWMTYERKEIRFETDAVRDKLVERPEYKKYWGHMTAAEKKAEYHVDLNHRYDIAPYALLIDLLDRLIAATVTELTEKPDFRNISVVQQTRATGLKAEGTPVSARTKMTTTTRMPTLKRLLYHPVLAQRRRNLALRTCSKDVVITVEEEGEIDQFVQMSLIDSGAAVGSRLKDVSLEDVELSRLWRFLGKDSFKYWLTWSHRGTDLAIINNNTRLREMIQTQKQMAYESREVEGLPVYALSLTKGRAPIDKVGHVLDLILVSVCVVICWLIGLSVGSRVGMELGSRGLCTRMYGTIVARTRKSLYSRSDSKGGTVSVWFVVSSRGILPMC
jgi:hypothetical protein